MWNEAYLNTLLSEPSPALVEDMKKIDGDIMILGAGGKIGPTLAVMAKQAIERAGIQKNVIAVARSMDEYTKKFFSDSGIEPILADLLNDEDLKKLPDVKNILFLAGRKFGTNGSEELTWSANASMPTLVARRFRGANIVAFSSGNIYPKVPPYSGGSLDGALAAPLGEYAMSSLARERIFEFAVREYGSKVLILRLNFAIDLRYGVLYDIANTLLSGESIRLEPACFNCVWQGYVNEVTIRSLLHVGSPAKHLNITGPETVSVRYAAEALGKGLNITPNFIGEEADTTFLSNSNQCFMLFGYPTVTLGQMIEWQAQWLNEGGRSLGKPTHFEEHGGKF